MKKHTFIGDKTVMAHWIDEFPDLVNLHVDLNDISGFVTQQLTDSQLMPKKIRIDASSLCQLKCKSCYMRLNNSGTIGNGYLSFANFKTLIESNPFIKEVELSNSGEIFLNPDLIKIVEYAFSKGVRLTSFNGVNLNTVTDVQLEALVRFHFYSLTISIDGASQDTYSSYRKNGNYHTVIENIKKLIAYKTRYKSGFPHIIWQYIIMACNEMDVPLAKIKAKDLGIPIYFKLTWDKDYQPTHIDMLKKETGLQTLTRDEYRIMTGKTYFGTLACRQMFFSPQINWDGRLLGCCEVYKQDYGVNVFETGLRKALQTFNFIQAKRFILGQVSIDSLKDDCPCISCEKRLQMKMMNEKFVLFDDIGQKI